MASENGRLLTCDRCGETVFLKCIGEETSDGGWTKWSKFEPEPDGWLYEYEMGHLCPGCAFLFKSWVSDFMYGRLEINGK